MFKFEKNLGNETVSFQVNAEEAAKLEALGANNYVVKEVFFAGCEVLKKKREEEREIAEADAQWSTPRRRDDHDRI